MTRIFINQLPQNLSAIVGPRYDALLPIFKKYAFSESESNQYYTFIKINYETACLFLEMALFYKSILMPVYAGSEAFINLGNVNKSSSIKIGNYTLTDSERKKIMHIECDFNVLLEKYHIPPRMLLFSDIKSFARDLNLFFKEQHE